MKEELRLRLRDQIPEGFQLESSMDYPDDGIAKIRGTIGKWAVIIEYDYKNNEDVIWMNTYGISSEGNSGELKLENLKNVLLSLS